MGFCRDGGSRGGPPRGPENMSRTRACFGREVPRGSSPSAGGGASIAMRTGLQGPRDPPRAASSVSAASPGDRDRGARLAGSRHPHAPTSSTARDHRESDGRLGGLESVASARLDSLGARILQSSCAQLSKLLSCVQVQAATARARPAGSRRAGRRAAVHASVGLSAQLARTLEAQWSVLPKLSQVSESGSRESFEAATGNMTSRGAPCARKRRRACFCRSGSEQPR